MMVHRTDDGATETATASANLFDVEKERFTRNFIESSRDCIKTLDRRGNLLSMNRYGRCALGIEDVGAVLNKPLIDFWGPEDRPRLQQAIDAAACGGEGRFQAFGPSVCGTPRWWDIQITPIKEEDGSIEKLLAVSRDVTEQKQVEQALRSALADAEEARRTLQALEEALRDANARLLEADRRKNEFLAVLSHELRNPLTPIRNSVYILERAAPGEEQAKRARQVIDRQAQHMARLIEDLLDVTRISRGKINLRCERVDINALARATAEDYREAYSKNGIALQVQESREPLWVEGDATRLEQVIGNLLANSVKFTHRGGKVVLRVEARSSTDALITVSDSGSGMSSDTLRHIFEPFVQAAQTLDRTRGGLGLGLALVKGLVEMHGGRVTARSEGEGKGSQLTIALPLVSPADIAPFITPVHATSPTARRVLIIEDNIDAAESLREVLQLENHEVAVAYSGTDGVEAAHKHKPDVILCDIGLPGIDGYGVARALRLAPDAGLRSTYLVALSGYALQEDVLRAKAAGFDCHIAKPPSIETLRRLLTDAPKPAAA